MVFAFGSRVSSIVDGLPVTKILVTDGEERAALAVVRSLGRAGHQVDVCSPHRRPLAGGSRYAMAESRSPDPLAEPAAFARFVAEEVTRSGIELLIPISEASLRALLPRREDLRPATIPFPDAASFTAVSDKAEVLAVATGLGLSVPRQVTIDSGSTALPGALSELAFPVVIKPARSVVETGERRIKLRVGYAVDEGDLGRRLAALVPAAFPVLVQERIRGPGIGAFLLLWDGELLASFFHRRIREQPPDGGVSVYRESIASDPELLEASRRLLDRYEWRGVAMVEFKRDERSGRAFLMEVNGRFWGSLQLAIDAGVDFPALLVAAASGHRPSPVPAYRVGTRCRWWWGDVDHLIARLRSGPPAHAAGAQGGRLRAVADFLTLWRPGDHSEVLRLRDAGPFLRESVAWISNAARRRKGAGG